MILKESGELRGLSGNCMPQSTGSYLKSSQRPPLDCASRAEAGRSADGRTPSVSQPPSSISIELSSVDVWR